VSVSPIDEITINYGRRECFDCLLSPDVDDPIFIGIIGLVAKGLVVQQHNTNNNGNGVQYNRVPRYPCPVTNRFECPYDYEKDKVSYTDTNVNFKVEHLFDLEKMAFAVEIALAIARKAS